MNKLNSTHFPTLFFSFSKKLLCIYYGFYQAENYRAKTNASASHYH
uniref:Uncharacterized protein n=1 Tax=Rhizophora mucronata TaxID=61149 RepID=A0A2P2IHQ6_RHIMU